MTNGPGHKPANAKTIKNSCKKPQVIIEREAALITASFAYGLRKPTPKKQKNRLFASNGKVVEYSKVKAGQLSSNKL